MLFMLLSFAFFFLIWVCLPSLFLCSCEVVRVFSVCVLRDCCFPCVIVVCSFLGVEYLFCLVA